VTKTATLIGVSRATVSKLMASYMNHGKTTTVKRNSGRKSTDRKRSSYIEKECLKKSQNYCSTGDRAAELNTYPEHPVTTKICPMWASQIKHPQ
jgi:hypothetical protein